jgi:hypothetical protein
MIGGYVTVGPNAVLAMAREGYRRGAVDLKEVAGLLAFPGFWRVMRNHAGSAVTELKNSLWRRGYLAECRKFCPELTLDGENHREGRCRYSHCQYGFPGDRRLHAEKQHESPNRAGNQDIASDNRDGYEEIGGHTT